MPRITANHPANMTQIARQASPDIHLLGGDLSHRAASCMERQLRSLLLFQKQKNKTKKQQKDNRGHAFVACDISGWCDLAKQKFTGLNARGLE